MLVLEVQCGRLSDVVPGASRLNAYSICVDVTDRPTVPSHTSLQTELHGTQKSLSLGLFHGTQFVVLVPTLLILYFL